MNDVYSTEEIARHIAAVQAKTEEQWRLYHPIVKSTVEWLDEHNFLAIVAEEPTGTGTGIPPEGP